MDSGYVCLQIVGDNFNTEDKGLALRADQEVGEYGDMA
jgi:hypothetical protein